MFGVSTLSLVELGVLGPLQVLDGGVPVAIAGAKPRALLTMLGLHGDSVIAADALMELLWGDDPPRTAIKALQTHISALRRALGDGVVLTEGTGWRLGTADVDAARYRAAARMGRDAAAAGDTGAAVACFEEALRFWRGVPDLPDSRRGIAERTRWIEGHAALVEDRADAVLDTGRAAEIIGELEAAVADAPLRERRWGQLMIALYRSGRQGDALAAFQRARATLAAELGVDPGPELRRLEAAIVSQDSALEIPMAQHLPSVMRAVTFLLTDIEGSTVAWEIDPEAMGVALARHDELVQHVVTARGGRLVKTRGEGDATFSVFERPSSAAAAALELQDAITHEPWALRDPLRIRIALHTGEVELRDGDYFGRTVNRAARLRSLSEGGQILCSGATAELVVDSLPDDVALSDLGMRQLKNLARPEHVFELRAQADEAVPTVHGGEVDRPELPAVLAGPGPFVGRAPELERLQDAWTSMSTGGTRAVLIAGEPGVGKTRLAGEWSRQVYERDALVLYGRCDEDLAAPYQPFAEVLRPLMGCLDPSRLRGLRGVEALLPLAPALSDVLPDLTTPVRADPDTERYALFDAVVAVLELASAAVPVVMVLDDLHWAAKPTLLLLRHLLRFGEHSRMQIVGTYRSTDLDRSHPLAAMLSDLHRDGTADRLTLGGLDEIDVSAYVAEAGYDDPELGRALASITGGNPFFLIEALRHVAESGGRWDQSTLPQGVREAVSRRLSRLPDDTNKALAAAAVVGTRFAVELVEQVVDRDLLDAFDDACKAGIVIEEPGGHYRFNHAIVRQSLLAELASVRRMRLHQRIAVALETRPGADDELLAELAYHYYECAWAGNAAKAVDYCRRAADQAMARLGYEGAAELYDRALHALDEIDDELPDREDQTTALLVARCEALLAGGDVASAAGAVSQLQRASSGSERLAAWATCFDGQLSMLVHPERLDDIETTVSAAAITLARLDDAAGESKAHGVRAACLARLGRIGDCEIALDDALTAARRAGEHRRANEVLAGAPLAALWGPSPVPRAGGRCLDVVRLLRITTDSPAVEATSTRCQAVLEAYRGRSAAARRMIDVARRTVSEFGLRHAVLEVEQFAGTVELLCDDPIAAEGHLRLAYNGFRRMGLDSDTAETAALLGVAVLELDRDAEADELCAESQSLAGHALKASIAWRTLRARLLSRGGQHDAARRMAESAVALAERTDALVDHGDACLALARVLDAASDEAGARGAAERAAGLYERKGAVALADKASALSGADGDPAAPVAIGVPALGLDNECLRVIDRLEAALTRDAWDEFQNLFAPEIFVENRRKIVGNAPRVSPRAEWVHEVRTLRGLGARYRYTALAVRGDNLALTRLEVSAPDETPGAPREELLQLVGLDERHRINLQIWFEADDIDGALAELDARYADSEIEQSTRRLDNAAIRTADRMTELVADKHWDEVGALFAENVVSEDRRRGLQRESHDRAIEVANLRTITDQGVVNIVATPLATRGDRLCLNHVTLYSDDGLGADSLVVIGVEDGLIVAMIAFDVAARDHAYVELDAHYLAGEAAPYAPTWSTLASAFVALNRHEIPPTTGDYAVVDHQLHYSVSEAGGLSEFLHASWDLTPDLRMDIATVHLLRDSGAVVTVVVDGSSYEGFDADWRFIEVLTCDGNLVKNCETFDESDLEAALTRFDELARPQATLEKALARFDDLGRVMPRTANAAIRVYAHLWIFFEQRDWAAVAAIFSDTVSTDDRRRVINAGPRRGREVEVANLRQLAKIGAEITWDVIASRGERLILARVRSVNSDLSHGEFGVEMLVVIETDVSDRIVGGVLFDAGELDAALHELDARYLTGEGGSHAHTWSVVARNYAAFNEGHMPVTSPNWVTLDHRRGTPFSSGDVGPYIRTIWDVTPDLRIYVEAVHRLSDRGAVFTHAARGRSSAGFDAEWRVIQLLMLEGEELSRCEIFDENEVDAALARFDELRPDRPPLENAASRAYHRLNAAMTARDLDAVAAMLADDCCDDDRRRVVSGGVRRGREAWLLNLQEVINVGVKNFDAHVVAIRGERLALSRTRVSGSGRGPDVYGLELLCLNEIDVDGRITAGIVFDVDDIDAAFDELDARYIAGEAAAHAQTWSVFAAAFSAASRHEPLELAPDWQGVDHRSGIAFPTGQMTEYLTAIWDQMPNFGVRIERVHRLTDDGAVVTHVANGTSFEGFAAEWRGVNLSTLDRGRVNRFELFDEDDLDAALARFDELGS